MVKKISVVLVAVFMIGGFFSFGFESAQNVRFAIAKADDATSTVDTTSASSTASSSASQTSNVQTTATSTSAATASVSGNNDNNNCVPNAATDLTGSVTNKGTGAGNNGTITNNSTNCTYTVGMASYKEFSSDIKTQTLFDTDSKTVAPGQTVTLHVNVPTCAYQTDLFSGSVINSFAENPPAFPWGETYHGDNTFIDGYGGYFGSYCTNTPPPPPPPPTLACADGHTLSLQETWDAIHNGNITLNLSKINSVTQVQSLITNNTGCAVPVSLMTYKMFDDHLSTQVMFDNTGVVNVSAHASGTLVANLPSCMVQADLYYGQGPTHLDDLNSAANITLAFIFNLNNGKSYSDASGSFCTNQQATTTTLTLVKTVVNTGGGTKQVSDFHLYINGNTATSGTAVNLTPGAYSATEQNFSDYTAGNWGGDCSNDGHVTLASGDHKICTITNTFKPAVVIPPTLSGSCTVNPQVANIGDLITFTATSTGGVGSNTYVWSGDESLSGSVSTTTKTYSSSGTKNATVVITSGTASTTANCSVSINAPTGGTSFAPYCVANPQTINTGNSITWTATVPGISSTTTLTYAWSGTDSLTGTSSAVSQIYSSVGTKNASVSVSDGTHTATTSCSANVNEILSYTGGGGGCVVGINGCGGIGGGGGGSGVSVTPISGGGGGGSVAGVFLSQVPYTGIGDNATAIAFAAGLMIWSSVIAYVLIKRKAHKDGITFSQAVQNLSAGNTYAFASEAPSLVEEVRETVIEKPVQTSSQIIESLENRARQLNALVSADGLNYIARTSGDDEQKAVSMLEGVVNSYKTTTESGDWIALNESKIQSLA